MVNLSLFAHLKRTKRVVFGLKKKEKKGKKINQGHALLGK
jgi:hypothetical protein